MSPKVEPIVISEKELTALLERVCSVVDKKDGENIVAITQSYTYLLQLIEDVNITNSKLRKIIFGQKTETQKQMKLTSTDTNDSMRLDSEGELSATKNENSSANSAIINSSDPEPTPKKKKGHGKNGADAYPNAQRICIHHQHLSSGDICPECNRGKLYPKKPLVFVKINGAPPLSAAIYEQESFRCNLCGKIFNADLENSPTKSKYDESAYAIMILLKYGTGIPFYRLDQLQSSLETPLATSTQWDKVMEASDVFLHIFEVLCQLASDSSVIHIDDTTARILDQMGKRLEKRKAIEEEINEGNKNDRTGTFTTGVVAHNSSGKIALYFTGQQHAGENMNDLLEKRNVNSDPPIQMSDALSRNKASDFDVIIAKCLVHARRNFVDIMEIFPSACRVVIDKLGKVYRIEKITRKENLSPKDRLEYHQKYSAPIMDELYDWLKVQFDDRLVEPNSGLGKAISYALNHWEGLTLFLRKEGAPLDNNICEMILKKSVLSRKNSYFFRSKKGANIADLYMSIIKTCEMNKVNPYKYLAAILKNKDFVAEKPENWLPWNYEMELDLKKRA